mmetsp:Transcript_38330/g.120666  ORF Transcript_38330/g.120666 Transcript_38330/m.120666 type:complete len:1644 (-) Transcript_38330:81-5012(-)
MRRLVQLKAASDRNRSSAGFSEYLERHKVFNLISDLISEVLLVQPDDPLRFVHDATARLLDVDKFSPEEVQDDHEEEETMQEADNERLALRMRIECVGSSGKVERSYFVRKCPSSGTSELRIQSWKEEAMDELCRVVEKAFKYPSHPNLADGVGVEVGSGREESSGSWVLDDQFRTRLKDLHDRMKGGRSRSEIKSMIFELSMQTGLSSEVLSGLYDLDFGRYEESVQREREILRKEWSLVHETNVVRVLARSLPGGSPDSPLSFLDRATPAELKSVWSKLTSLLAGPDVERNQSKSQLAVSRRGASGNSKFEIFTNGKDARVATFGRLGEFYKGLIDKIGLPSPQLMRAMESEHCMRGDSQDEFEPGNYDTRTTPCKEWQALTDEATRRRLSVPPRRIRSMEDLMKEHVVQSANLLPEEVLALQLYSGPMFRKYNTVLRKFPETEVKALKSNNYVTTIFCVVSGIIKLSRVSELSESRLVFRGLKDLSLPQEFFTEDEYGVRGGIEFAMMSTTRDKSVALQYVGTGTATVFEIVYGAVDRGASIGFLSQYPDEDEILFPPLSFLEVVGQPRVEGGPASVPIRIIPLKINANVTCSTIEEIVEKRKQLHMALLTNTMNEAIGELNSIFASERVEARLTHAPYDRMQDGHHKIKASILTECQELMDFYAKSPPSWFNDDENYAKAMLQASKLKQMALGKFVFWLDHNSGDGMAGTITKESIFYLHRLMESNLLRRFRDKDEEEDREALALQICKHKGLIFKDLAELNDLGEPPLFAVVANGDEEGVELLLTAGCEIDSRDRDKSSVLHVAAFMGHTEMIDLLIQRQADLYAVNSTGHTCLHTACRNGHVDVVRRLIALGGERLVLMQTNTGWLCTHSAAQNGHFKVLEVLLQVACEQQLSTQTNTGWYCVHTAAQNGHVRAIRLILQTGGNQQLLNKTNDLRTVAYIASQYGHMNVLKLIEEAGMNESFNMLTDDDKSCAYMAARFGFIEVLRYLIAHCDKSLFAVRTLKDQHSCVTAACSSGSVEALRLVHEVVGSKVVQEQARDGKTCFHMAAIFGHVEIMRELIAMGHASLMSKVSRDASTCAFTACTHGHAAILQLIAETVGTDLLFKPSRQKRSCAFIACQNGHMDCLRLLLHTAGRELFDQLTDDGTTCAHIAAFHGHLNVLQFLVENIGENVIFSSNTAGKSVAMFAAENGKIGAIKFLLQHGGRETILRPTSMGKTCAHVACAKGDLEMLQLILDIDAAELLSMLTKRGESCVHFCAKRGREDVMQLVMQLVPHEFLTLRTEEGIIPLHLASQYGNLQVFELLVEKAGKEQVASCTAAGDSCLLLAAANGHVNVVGRLLEEMPSLVEVANDKGESCVYAAASNGHVPVLSYLLRTASRESLLRGIKDGGFTSAHMAAVSGQREILKMLHEAAGDELLFLLDHNGRSCAYLAVQNGRLDVLEYLVSVGGRQALSARTVDGKSCLHAASQGGRVEEMKVMMSVLDFDDLLLTDNHGKSCLHVAVQQGHAGIVEVLLGYTRARELVGLESDQGRSSAYVASQEGHSLLLQRLLEVGGAELLNRRAKDGRTCAHVAAQNGHLEVLQVIAETGGPALFAVKTPDGQTCRSLAEDKKREKVLLLMDSLEEAGAGASAASEPE